MVSGGEICILISTNLKDSGRTILQKLNQPPLPVHVGSTDDNPGI